MIICFSKARFTVLFLPKMPCFNWSNPHFSISFWCFSLGFSPPTSWTRDLFGTWPMPSRRGRRRDATVTTDVTWCCSPQAADPSPRGAAPFPPRSAAPFPHRLEVQHPNFRSFLGCVGRFFYDIFLRLFERDSWWSNGIEWLEDLMRFLVPVIQWDFMGCSKC